MAAVFRTPLGAALLAVEVFYRDDFESDALIPALLASVVSYSVFISIFGESRRSSRTRRATRSFPRICPLRAHGGAHRAVRERCSCRCCTRVQSVGSALRVPAWVRPALGGLALGICGDATRDPRSATRIGAAGAGARHPRRRLRRRAGRHHRRRMASRRLDGSASSCCCSGCAKIIATSLTVGTGGSAGDFGPRSSSAASSAARSGARCRCSSTIRASIPAPSRSSGMGTFYGGIAHVPISSLVMVCELAGSYDLLVPLMLAEGIAFVALRKRALYHAQLPTKRESPAHRHDLVFHTFGIDARRRHRRARSPVRFLRMATPSHQVIHQIAESSWQDVFPVVGKDGKMLGMVHTELLRTFASQPDFELVTVAADLMQAPLSVPDSENLHVAIELMLRHQLRELPIVDDIGQNRGISR